MSAIAESTSPCGDVVQRTFVQHPTLIPCGNVGLSRYPALQKCLPPGFDYHVCSVEETQTEFDHTAVSATIRLTLKTEEEAKEWLLKTRCTPMTWRVDSKKTTTGKRTICNIVYKCQHHVRSVTANTRRSSKNTDCPAKMTLTVHRIPVAKGRKSRSKDLHMPQYPTVITLQNIHNHDIYSTGSLKHRDVGQKAIETLTELFESGHTPRSALTVLQSDLQAKYGDNYVHVAADRATCPDLRFCQNLYKSIRESKAECGSAEGNGMSFAPLESDSEMFEPLEGDSEVFEEAETTVQLQPLSSSTKAATEGLEGAKASDVFDREKFCSTIEKFKETVLNNEGLQGGALDMMKTLDMVMGNHSLLLSAMRRFGSYGTNGRASQSGTIAAAAQLTSIARRRVKPGGRGRLTALRPKKNVASMDHRNSYPNGV